MMGLPISAIKLLILAQFIAYIIASPEPNHHQRGQNEGSEKGGRNPTNVNKDDGSESRLSQEGQPRISSNETHNNQRKKLKINRKASYFKLKTNSSILKQFHNAFVKKHKNLFSKFKTHLSGTKLGNHPNTNEAQVTHSKISTSSLTEPSKFDETTTQQSTSSENRESEEKKSGTATGNSNESSLSQGDAEAPMEKFHKARLSGADIKIALNQVKKAHEQIKQENFEKFKEFLKNYNPNKPRALFAGTGSKARGTSGEVMDYTSSQLKELYRVWRKNAEGNARENTDDVDDEAITPSKLKKLYAEWAANALIEEEEKRTHPNNFNDQDSTTATSEEDRRSSIPSKPKRRKTSQERPEEGVATNDEDKPTKHHNKWAEKSSKQKPESEELHQPTMDVEKLEKYYKKWSERSSDEKSTTQKPDSEEWHEPTMDIEKLTKYYKKWSQRSSDETKRDNKEPFQKSGDSEDDGQGSIDGSKLTNLYDKWAKRASAELSEGDGTLDSQKLSKVYDKWAMTSSAERREEEALKREQDEAPQEVKQKGTINSKKLAKHYDEWRQNYMRSSTGNPVEDVTSHPTTSRPEESSTVRRESFESTTVERGSLEITTFGRGSLEITTVGRERAESTTEEVARAQTTENPKETSRERMETSAGEDSNERKETEDREVSQERRKEAERQASKEKRRQADKEATRERKERRKHKTREDSRERKSAPRASKKRKEHKVRESPGEASKEMKGIVSAEASIERRNNAKIDASSERQDNAKTLELEKPRKWRQRAFSDSTYSTNTERKTSRESESRESSESGSREEGRSSSEESSSEEDSESEKRKHRVRSSEDVRSDQTKKDKDCLDLDGIKPEPNAAQLEAAVENHAKQLASYDAPKGIINLNLQAEIPSSSVRLPKISESLKVNSQAALALLEGRREESIAKKEQFVRADVSVPEPHVQVNLAVERISEPRLTLPVSVLMDKNINNYVKKEEVNQAELEPKIPPPIAIVVRNPGNSMEKLTIAETKAVEDNMRKHELASHLNVDPEDIRTAKLYAFSTKKYDSKISDATNALGSVKVRWWEQLWPWTDDSATKKLESEIESSVPNFSLKSIIPKFKMYKNQLKILISRMVPRCPEVHSMKLLKTWVSMFRSAWPNLLRMTNLSVKYAEALKNQLTTCLDTIVERKFGSSKLYNPEPVSVESEETIKVKREPTKKELYIQEFNEELANPLISYFAKLPQMVQGETPILRRKRSSPGLQN